MTVQKKFITLAIVLVVAVAAFFVGRYGMDKYRDHLSDKQYDAKIDAIHAHIPGRSKEDFHRAADRLHDFVRANSQHKMDEEFYSLWPDRMKLADAFIDGLEGKRKDKPHMECSTRSNILAALHEKEGRRVRNVVMYSPANNLLNHRVIEVLNPETGGWEAYDVTYDMYYKNKDSGKRASIAEVGAAPESHYPCNTKGDCGWNIKTDDALDAENLRDYLKIITIHDKESDLRISLRSDDIKEDHVYKTSEDSGTFCDLFSKNCPQGFLSYADGLSKTLVD